MFLSTIEEKVKRGFYTSGVKYPGEEPFEPKVSIESKYFSQVLEEYKENLNMWKMKMCRFNAGKKLGFVLFKKDIIKVLLEKNFNKNQAKNAFNMASEGDKDFFEIIKYLRRIEIIFNGGE